jgi:hypothetical protein
LLSPISLIWLYVFNFLFKSYPFNQHLNFLILYTINNEKDQKLGFFSFFVRSGVRHDKFLRRVTDFGMR